MRWASEEGGRAGAEQPGEHAAERDRGLMVMQVVLALVCSGVYLLVFTGVAVQDLLDPPPAAGPETASPESVRNHLVGEWVLVLIGLWALWSLTVPPVVPRSSLGFARPDIRVSRMVLLTVAVFGFLQVGIGQVRAALVSLLSLNDPNPNYFAGYSTAEVIASSVQAGVCEEILVLAVPLVLLERTRLARWRLAGVPAGWLVIGAVLVLLRMSYHVYRGWATLQFLPWAIAAVAVFYWTRALVAMVVSHALFDAIVLTVSEAAWYWVLGVSLLAAAVAVVLLVRRGDLRSSAVGACVR